MTRPRLATPAVSLLVPAIVGAAIFAVTCAWIAVRSLQGTGGTPVYPLDDTYIQMTIARTLASSGTYGFLPGVPAFSSSSPLWVLLLALGAPGGVLGAMPALLNITFSLLLLATSLRYLARDGLSTTWLITAAISLNVIVPLGTTAAVGLEHTAHAWATIAFATLVATASARPAQNAPSRALLVLAAVLVGLRFEGLFLIACSAVLFARRRLSTSVALVLAGLLPVAIHAAVALWNGWTALPSPLVVKGHYPAEVSSAAVVGAVVERIDRLGQLWAAAGAFDMSALLLVAGVNGVAIVWAITHGDRTSTRLRLSLLFLGTLAIHASVAKLDRAYGRYGMYLVTMGVVAGLPWVRELVGALAAGERRPRRAARLACVAALLAVCVVSAFAVRRTARLTIKVPVGSREMYLQQHQMATFAREALAGQGVAVNDLGLMAYRGGVRPFDVIGLGTIEMARLYRSGGLTPAAIDDLARQEGVVAAMVYPGWIAFLAGGVPASWIPIADLMMSSAQVAGYPSVRIYALNADGVDALRASLRAFAPRLPEGAWVTWIASEPHESGAVDEESHH